MGRPVKFTGAEIQEAVNAYTTGSNVAEVAEILGVHRLVTTRILRQAGVEIRPATLSKKSRDQVHEAKKLFMDGMSIKSIAKELERPYSTVRYWLKERDTRPGHTYLADQIHDSTKKKIVHAFENGASLIQLRRDFNVSPSVLDKILVDSGCKITDSRTRKGPDHYLFKGGRQFTHEGYVNIWIPEDSPYASMRNARGLVKEHRLVMAKHLGRPLYPYEQVHHLNGIKDDNRSGNLELWTRDHPSGTRVDEYTAPHCPTCTCHPSFTQS